MVENGVAILDNKDKGFPTILGKPAVSTDKAQATFMFVIMHAELLARWLNSRFVKICSYILWLHGTLSYQNQDGFIEFFQTQ